MTVSRRDVQAFGSGPALDAPSISPGEADRVAAVLNRSSIHRPGPTSGSQPTVDDEPGLAADTAGDPGLPAGPTQPHQAAEPGRREPAPNDAPRRPRGDVLRLLQRAGFSSAQLDLVRAQLPEEVDGEQERHVLARYGLSRAMLMERFGSSP